MFADPQVKHLGIVRKVETRNGEMLNVVGQPVTLSRTPAQVAAPPPALGEHSLEVLREFGFANEEIDALRRGGVI